MDKFLSICLIVTLMGNEFVFCMQNDCRSTKTHKKRVSFERSDLYRRTNNKSVDDAYSEAWWNYYYIHQNKFREMTCKLDDFNKNRIMQMALKKKRMLERTVEVALCCVIDPDISEAYELDNKHKDDLISSKNAHCLIANNVRALCLTRTDNYRLVEKILALGANPSLIVDTVNPPLFLARSIAMIELLIKYGASIYQTNLKGDTILHHCMKNSCISLQVMKLYIAMGVPLEAKNAAQLTPVKIVPSKIKNYSRTQLKSYFEKRLLLMKSVLKEKK